MCIYILSNFCIPGALAVYIRTYVHTLPQTLMCTVHCNTSCSAIDFHASFTKKEIKPKTSIYITHVKSKNEGHDGRGYAHQQTTNPTEKEKCNPNKEDKKYVPVHKVVCMSSHCGNTYLPRILRNK